MVHDAGIRSGLFTTFYDYDRYPLFSMSMNLETYVNCF